MCVDSGYLLLMDQGAFLTPDNADKVYPRMVKLLLKILGEPEVIKYEDHIKYVVSLPSAIAKHIYKRNFLTLYT